MSSPKPVILCVDDEPNVLSGLRRTLHREFEVVTAEGGHKGLEALASRDDFAVVVSDMRMPQMSGAEFLARACERWPEVTRILLTGQSDMDSAIMAVNEGQIFRFLTKPADPETLSKALGAAVDQHRLVIAERELTQGTVRGVVNVLVDVLSMVSPRAHASTGRVVDDVTTLAGILELPDAWEFEVAAMLSSLGRVALPDDVLERVAAGRGLTPEEREQVERVPQVSGDLIDRIPRLGRVADMVRLQAEPLRKEWLEDPSDRLGIGAGLLRLAYTLEERRAQGMDPAEAEASILAEKGQHHPWAVDALQKVMTASSAAHGGAAPPRRVELSALTTGMVLEEDIVDGSGTLLVSKGYVVTSALVERLARFRSMRQMPDDVLVRGEAAAAAA